jgi:hypothetical protein
MRVARPRFDAHAGDLEPNRCGARALGQAHDKSALASHKNVAFGRVP